MSLKEWTLVGCALVNAYLLGVMVLFATVVYPGFGAVDRAFPALYADFTSRIPGPVVAFEFLALIATLLLYVWRPTPTPLLAVHLLVALGSVYFLITFGWHLPAHRPLGAGENGAATLAPILRSQWARTMVQTARVTILAWLAAHAG